MNKLEKEVEFLEGKSESQCLTVFLTGKNAAERRKSLCRNKIFIMDQYGLINDPCQSLSLKILSKVDKIFSGLDLAKTGENIVIFINENTEKVLELPFKVNNKIVVKSGFDLTYIKKKLKESFSSEENLTWYFPLLKQPFYGDPVQKLLS